MCPFPQVHRLCWSGHRVSPPKLRYIVLFRCLVFKVNMSIIKLSHYSYCLQIGLRRVTGCNMWSWLFGALACLSYLQWSPQSAKLKPVFPSLYYNESRVVRRIHFGYVSEPHCLVCFTQQKCIQGVETTQELSNGTQAIFLKAFFKCLATYFLLTWMLW